MVTAAANPSAVTYAEVRAWARWLQAFTASDLAQSLHCSREVAERGVRALLWHRICRDTGGALPGPDGDEAVIEYVPLPPGPTEHFTETPPEILVPRLMGGDPLHVPRGLPVAAVKKVDPRRAGITGRSHSARTQVPKAPAQPQLVKQPKRRRNRHRAKQTEVDRGSSNG